MLGTVIGIGDTCVKTHNHCSYEDYILMKAGNKQIYIMSNNIRAGVEIANWLYV